jgi:peroxiredoxin Q/BCP
MKSIAILALAALAAAAGPAAGCSDEAERTLAAGDAAPAFALPGSDGRTHSLEAHLGTRAVVVAWFPKAFTGG